MNIYKQSCPENTAKSEEYRQSCTKYNIRFKSYGLEMALPPKKDVRPLPNLGGKVNPHFSLNNSFFIHAEHPRLGLIQSAVPTRDIPAGQKLFVHYDYGEQYN